MDRQPLTVLLLEESERDAARIIGEIERSGFGLECQQACTAQAAFELLDAGVNWDLILAEYTFPDLGGSMLLQALQERDIKSPLILLADSADEERALLSVRSGADDFLLKDNLALLGLSITRALRGAQERHEVCAHAQQLRDYSLHQEQLRESERVNLAREVHDDLGGMLTSIKLDLRRLQRRCADSGHSCDAEAKFSLLGEQVDCAINTVRRIITELRPSVLDDLGLAAAIEWQLNEFAKHTQIKCLLDDQGYNRLLDNKSQEVAIFRLFQESLEMNKLAGASELRVTLNSDNDVLALTIEGNDKGITANNKPESGQYGIFGMYERARTIGACLEITAGITGSTRISLRLPLKCEGR